eukprot:TRINITY_DN22899_c0_g1_i1.p1 TRINITY_DN22899_c0_g1~~TRINITY_DN22899_c0_g1_i1.p1  ORF type:complete len:615 (+),score=132.68 TRINITY_DN22899_c0_g1_i1:212-2056(+)
MATEFNPEKPLEVMKKNLKVATSSKAANANMAVLKDGGPSDATSCISSSGDATSSFKESDVDQESLMAEQGMYYPPGSYYGYYYPGYDGSYGEWDDQGYFLGSDGLEIQYPAIQADNGSVIYYPPGFQPGYNAYSPYLAGAMVGIDGQYLGQQSYLPSPMFSQPLASPGYFPPPLPFGSELVPAFSWDSPAIYGDGAYGNGFGGGSTIPNPKPNLSPPSKSAPSSKSSTPIIKGSPPPTLDLPPIPGIQNQSLKPVNKVSQHGSGFQAAAVLSKGYFPVTKFSASPNQGKGSLLYPNSAVNIKANGRGWVGNEKFKTRSKTNGISDFDLLNEQNRGPRTNSAKNAWVSAADPDGALGAEGNINSPSATPVIRRDQYNLPDFPTKYDHALFFVIKSYSEDDIHKSIKYSVWASTPNGNKRLDSAYQDAQEKMREKGSKIPIFLFFSVNASGQFCGVAEMIGPVDFTKNMDFWQQDKWNGFFPVKWHIIKDIPNPQFRHIILENNENKPVTNSRDTQEVKFPQGTDMLNIFKNYMSKTSILDDFAFYESRQKAMQDKRIRPPIPHLDHLQQKPEEGGAEVTKAGDLKSVIAGLHSMELAPTKKNKEEIQLGGEVKE